MVFDRALEHLHDRFQNLISPVYKIRNLLFSWLFIFVVAT